MRISLNWLSDYIAVPFSADDLAHRLTMLGIEVEGMERPAEKMKDIVVGEVLEVSPHPNADKLRLTRVAVGDGEPLRIVCGAPNVAAGQKVPIAMIGADLGEGFVIKKSKIRGEVSEGMICSERELGMSNKHEGIWELPLEFKRGTPLAEALGSSDVLLDIGITPNRADCLSHIGIAREVRAMTGEAVRSPQVKIDAVGGEIAKQVRISLPEPELCPRYVAKLVRGVTIKPSPDWLKKKLEAVGLRPINNVVDVTNFVLMECGHPLHAFDFDTVESGEIVVRSAKEFVNEYVTLDGKKRKLPDGALLITDGQKPLGIAGIMGGENSSITDATKNVLIESAYFNPSSIRRTAKQLGLSTDASYRFERGTNFEVLQAAAERAAQMIVEVAGGEIVSGLLDEYAKQLTQKEFAFRPARARMLIGSEISDVKMRQVFERLDIEIVKETAEQWTLMAPPYRVDLEREVDAIEEVARVVGFEDIPTSTFEHAPLTGERDPLKRREFDELIRMTLLSLGANECVSVPLVSAKDAAQFDTQSVELINPLNAEKDRMRTSVGINLLDAARHNERFGAAGQRMFEIGSVFAYDRKKQLLGNVREQTQIGILIAGEQEPKTPYNAAATGSSLPLMKGIVDALVQRAGIDAPKYGTASRQYLDAAETQEVNINGQTIGVIGKLSAAAQKQWDLNHNAWIALLDHGAMYELAHAIRLKPKQVQALPKFPSVERDIAIVLSGDIVAADINREIRGAAPRDLLKDVRLFDEFQSKEMKAAGERSLAFHLVFRSHERTLEEKEVDEVTQQIIKHLERELHARLRA